MQNYNHPTAAIAHSLTQQQHQASSLLLQQSNPLISQHVSLLPLTSLQTPHTSIPPTTASAKMLYNNILNA